MMQTDPDILNRLWAIWLNNFNKREPDMLAWLPTYNRVQRSSDRAIRFETWVESNGGRVVQKNKKRYIEVWDENLFMMLVLQYV